LRRHQSLEAITTARSCGRGGGQATGRPGITSRNAGIVGAQAIGLRGSPGSSTRFARAAPLPRFGTAEMRAFV